MTSVTPVGDGPVVVSSGQLYSRVAVMSVQAADGKQYPILFLITGETQNSQCALIWAVGDKCFSEC